MRRLAPRKSAAPENSEFTACSSPSRVKAATSERKVSVVRSFFG
jgi:hypothetical protein